MFVRARLMVLSPANDLLNLCLIPTTNAEMCGECEVDGRILPSLESFQMRLKQPLVNYVFYEYVFKPVVGEGAWNRRLNASRFGTNALEAYAHALLQNNYMAWVFDYRQRHPGSTLKTEYDLAKSQQQQGSVVRIFCGDLDGAEIAAGVTDDNDDEEETVASEYTVVYSQAPHEEAYEEAREGAEKVRNETLAQIRIDHGRLDSYGEVNTLLMSDDMSSISSCEGGRAATKAQNKKKRKVMMNLKMYTGGDAATKRKRGSDTFKGWSEEGKKFMVKMAQDIKADVESGAHGEWEKMYKKICNAVKDSEEQEVTVTEADYVVLYEEV